ncbi:MAG: HAD domain-containing protein [Sulfuricella sp.]
MNGETAIIFLDFDGVLHPEYDGEPTPADRVFCHLPRFEAVMRDFPLVEIVISSMWRHQFTLDQLRARFSPDIAARIIGATSETDRIDGQYLPARREGEILEWLAATGRKNAPWIALDDAAWQFQQHRERIVASIGYIGLDDGVETRLRAALTGLS